MKETKISQNEKDENKELRNLNQYTIEDLPNRIQMPSKLIICKKLKYYDKCSFSAKFGIPCPYSQSTSEWRLAHIQKR